LDPFWGVTLAEFLLFFSLAAIVYIYVGYPCLIFVATSFLRKRVYKADIEPTVSILIAAYNEGDCIRDTLLNKLQLEYPKDKLEIIVVSDASDDGTDRAVQEFAACNVSLLRQKTRQGKTAALNIAVSRAKGDILVFSDANSIYRRDALRKLTRNFQDASVGYVTGKMIYSNPDGSRVGDGCTAYMRYENFLRKAETSVGSIVGVNGGIDAVRKFLYRPMRPDQLPDFVLPLIVRKQGFRVVFEPEAILNEDTLKSDGDEYRMRVRVALRALWALLDMREMLSLRTYPLFGWQLWSHKVLRYMAFIFILIAFFSNMSLLKSGFFFQVLFSLQIGAYLLAFFSSRLHEYGPIKSFSTMCRYFALLNLASAHAFVLFLFGRRVVLWTPRKG